MLKLIDGVKADMVMTDPPYILDYLKGKSKQKDGVTRGFGAKRNRVYRRLADTQDKYTLGCKKIQGRLCEPFQLASNIFE